VFRYGYERRIDRMERVTANIDRQQGNRVKFFVAKYIFDPAPDRDWSVKY
jgi:hypothetical protein